MLSAPFSPISPSPVPKWRICAATTCLSSRCSFGVMLPSFLSTIPQRAADKNDLILTSKVAITSSLVGRREHLPDDGVLTKRVSHNKLKQPLLQKEAMGSAVGQSSRELSRCLPRLEDQEHGEYDYLRTLRHAKPILSLNVMRLHDWLVTFLSRAMTHGEVTQSSLDLSNILILKQKKWL